MNPKPDLRLVAAMGLDRGIGRDNQLPWRLPDDLRRFKALTLGNPVLMGRKTAESLGRALPGRDNLVLTRSGRVPFDAMTAVGSLDEAMSRCANETLMVIGGGEIYALALPHASHLHLTYVDIRVAGADAFFPDFDRADWDLVSRETHPADARHEVAFEYVDYRRRAVS